MARRVDVPRRRPALVALVAIGVLVFVGLVGAMLVLGSQRHEQTDASASPSSVASGIAVVSLPPSLSPSNVAVPSPAPTPVATTSPAATATPAASPGATPTPTSSATPPASAAPTSAADFDVHNQVIEIGFPLRADTAYHYRDNWYERRTGPPYGYNHAKQGPDGQLVRLHDGIDIYAPENEPVLSPFDGVVIDPATQWTPWEPDRYGLTVVVQSDEPGTEGYTAVLVHLDRVWVEIGQHVTRGEVIGVLGRTGNAENVQPQLHFELRAPFEIDWSALGEDRLVDAFNPYPSLVAADPNH